MHDHHVINHLVIYLLHVLYLIYYQYYHVLIVINLLLIIHLIHHGAVPKTRHRRDSVEDQFLFQLDPELFENSREIAFPGPGLETFTNFYWLNQGCYFRRDLQRLPSVLHRQ